MIIVIVCEYLSRPSLPPPFIIISHIWRFTLHVCAKCLKLRCIRARYDELLKRTKYRKKNKIYFRVKINHRCCCFLETVLDEKKVKNIEIAEDALGDEVYYNYLKSTRKLLDETDLDEERV